MTTQEKREAIRCTCCGREIMAEIVDGKLVFRKRIHGKVHVLLTEPKSEAKITN